MWEDARGLDHGIMGRMEGHSDKIAAVREAEATA